ncbi:MAG: flagellar motor switch protein FliN [Anaerolineales bacterium]|nr:flagellar motor switch protein FliN [Anaerolineales bacterium]
MSERPAPDINPDAQTGSVPEGAQAPAAMPAPEPAGEQAAPARKVEFESLGNATAPAPKGINSLDMLMDVPMGVTVELGRAKMSVQEVLDLQSGSVIELDHLAGEAVDIFVNSHLMARGEVVVVDDRFGVRITQILAKRNGNGAF